MKALRTECNDVLFFRIMSDCIEKRRTDSTIRRHNLFVTGQITGGHVI